MAAKDYTFAEGIEDIYLVKKNEKDDGMMSSDRRPLTDNEQLYIAEHFLRRHCEKNDTDGVTISISGKPIFKMTLLENADKEETA